MRRMLIPFTTITLLTLLLVSAAAPALAQQPKAETTPGPFTVYTEFPSQVAGLGETVTLGITLKGGTSPQTVQLTSVDAPKGWDVSFRGNGKIVKSVFVDPANEASVDLRLEPSKDVKAGTYDFTVQADGETDKATLKIEITVQDKVPTSLTLSSDLPTLNGSPTSTFRYDATLKNEGADDISVNLSADAPDSFQVKFLLSGQETTSMPLNGKETKNISIQVQPVSAVAAGTYPITIHAEGSDASAELKLVADVSGQADITVTTQDGRLSGQATAGRDSTLKVTIRNTGSATAHSIALSANPPSGWNVTFDPTEISELPANQELEVTAHLVPSEKAVAGDYMVTISAKPSEGANKSADFRITVLTSTLWGIVGIILIAIAIGVVALAVMRFGRR